MYALLIVVCSFVLFLLTIVLSVLLRYTDSDYPFVIFKLFFSQHVCFLDLYFSHTFQDAVLLNLTYMNFKD
jgi:hypothetical protein